MLIYKHDWMLIVPDSGLKGRGRIVRKCNCVERCKWLPSRDRPWVLPCGCHGAIDRCRCVLRDRRCQTCGSVFVPLGPRWVQVADPHPEWRSR